MVRKYADHWEYFSESAIREVLAGTRDPWDGDMTRHPVFADDEEPDRCPRCDAFLDDDRDDCIFCGELVL